MRSLKYIRQAVAAVVFILFCLVFLNLYGELPDTFISGVLYFQLIPSFLKSLSGIDWLSSGFIAVLFMSLFFGRLYCSFLCPLGITIDLTGRLVKSKQKKLFRYTSPHRFLRYAILILTLGSFLGGTLVFVILLDPYSLFARMLTILVKPVIVVLNNGLSRLLESADIYSVEPYTQAIAQTGIVVFVALFTCLVLYLAIKKGRFYCNAFCPVGTLLGFLSGKALFKITIDPESCTSCGRCERHCKSSCIDSKQLRIDTSRCVTCFNCINRCPEESVIYSAVQRSKTSGERRRFLMLIALFASGVTKVAFAVNRPVVYVRNKVKIRRKTPITPPGSLSIDNFTEKCTACYLCVSECPGKVIQPNVRAFGGKGILMPSMDNKYGYCNYKCVRCSTVCPSGAILPVGEDEKKEIQVGRVIFIKENCIVVTQKTECGACSEHCPTKAVYLIVENNLRLPAVNPQICVGCGACEYACPAIPYKAIYIEGNAVHLKAAKPLIKKAEPAEPSDTFPF